MNVGEIIKDSLKYSFSNWKNFLFLGIIILIGDLHSIGQLMQNNGLSVLLKILGVIFAIVQYSYLTKIIKSSLSGAKKLPEFKNWKNMFIDGVKVLIVSIIYLIPVALIIIYGLFKNGTGFSELDIAILYYFGLLVLFYTIVIFPLLWMAITNMLYYESKFASAFRIREILKKISYIGWYNFVKWYITVANIFIVLFIVMFFIFYIFNSIYPNLGGIITSLTFIPYSGILIARSIALFYTSDEEDWNLIRTGRKGEIFTISLSE